ncbi:MAG TPA: helix-turn-helix domain-containing protein [Bauldia sp.]|nr:helix-turn-helix domain-containing protein [Bauldia sp.]
MAVVIQASVNTNIERGREGAARKVEAIVTAAFALGPSAMRDPRRGRAATAFARQVAMYLAHTRLGLSFTEAGAYFGRDRTTASHACRTVEDKREDPEIDAIVDVLERAIEVCPDLRPAA